MRTAQIKVPASSANIGPGFDVLGIALGLYLVVDVKIDRDFTPSPNTRSNCSSTASGEGAEGIALEADANLITRTASYVLRSHDVRTFPPGTQVHIHNDIPLGRGLGSSGAAVVAGVSLGNVVGNLGLSKRRMMDFCLMIERHPDNISAAMYGGFVGSFSRELSGTELERVEIPSAEVSPEPGQSHGGIDTGSPPPSPPQDISRSMQYSIAKEIKAVCVIPQFEVSTAMSRDVSPSAYTRQDAIYNSQRISSLIPALSQSPPDAELVHLAMQDRSHQRYRRVLVPGLSDISNTSSPRTHRGSLGVCLSGAGPTVSALATENFEEIADDIISTFKSHNVQCVWKSSEPAEGAQATAE